MAVGETDDAARISAGFERLLAAGDVSTWELDAEGRIVAVNPAAAAILGWSEGQLMGRELLELVHAADRDDARAQWAAIRGRPGEVGSLRTRCVDREGRPRWLAWSAVADGAGRVCALACDDTARTWAERRHHELAALCDLLASPVYVKDERGAYVFVNRAFEALLARRREEVVGRVDAEVLPTGAAESFARAEATARERGVPVEVEEPLGLGDPVRVYAAVRAALPRGAGEGAALIGAAADVTLRRQAEATLTAVEETIERRIAERTAAVEDASRAKSEFMARMSHELRTPLNAILGYSELIEDEMRERGEQASLGDLLRIRAAGKHLLSLINDILDISKIEAGKMLVHIEEFPLAVAIEEVAATSRPLIEKHGNNFRVDVAPGVGTMRSDPLKIRQCLLNLLSNAGKFTRGGQVVLSVARQMVNGRAWISFQVTDTGIGIAPEHIGQLFREFYQVDTSSTRRYGGTGLGLVITRRLCNMLGGEIRVVSKPGQGSNFTLELPAIHIEAGGPEIALELDVLAEKDVARARVAVRELCQKLGARPLSLQKIATIVSELARNMVLYAGGGKLLVGSVGADRKCVFVRAIDEGPGIADLDAILAGRRVSRNGRGLGLIGTKRLADGFRIHTAPTGTWIEAEVNL